MILSRQRKSQNQGSHSTPKAKKQLSDYQFYIGTASQASDFVKTKEFLVNYIKQTFDHGEDIGQALEHGKAFDFMKVKPNATTGASLGFSDAEAKAYDAEYMKLLVKRVETYQMNLSKAYAFLISKCAKGLQSKITQRADFTTKIEGDPIKLLAAIKEHSLSYEDTKYDMAIITESLRHLVNIRQGEEESLHDYTQRFRSAKDVFKSHLGGNIQFYNVLTSMPEVLAESDDDKRAKLEKTKNTEINERWLSYLYLTSADHKRYGSLVTYLAERYSLQKDEYPKTLKDTTPVLSNHKPDTSRNKTQTPRSDKKGDGDQGGDVNKETPIELSFAQMEGACYCCGKLGHMSNTCKLKDTIPRDQWAINKMKQQVQQHMQAGTGDNHQSAETPSPPSGES